ncbi:hypothetical protein [Shouchella shacheensis]|uniref:hypothetical protein n=1 Tax=Shouchella shacheensis TaxID=1649580 RepID=UPI0012F97E0E|nr:hypothetical protein [Shouchella shacheensis]
MGWLIRELCKNCKEIRLWLPYVQRGFKNLVTPVGENPKIASLIEHDFNKRWLHDPQYKRARKRHKEAALAGISPFKIDIAEDLKSKQENFNSEYQEEIDLFKNLSSKHISGILF